uniref:Uncharacterized protein n=1 Tax=Cucumis melo TaxID=3656 RepID=A0A9I9E4Y7_CUCME
MILCCVVVKIKLAYWEKKHAMVEVTNKGPVIQANEPTGFSRSVGFKKLNPQAVGGFARIHWSSEVILKQLIDLYAFLNVMDAARPVVSTNDVILNRSCRFMGVGASYTGWMARDIECKTKFTHTRFKLVNLGSLEAMIYYVDLIKKSIHASRSICRLYLYLSRSVVNLGRLRRAAVYPNIVSPCRVNYTRGFEPQILVVLTAATPSVAVVAVSINRLQPSVDRPIYLNQWARPTPRSHDPSRSPLSVRCRLSSFVSVVPSSRVVPFVCQYLCR